MEIQLNEVVNLTFVHSFSDSYVLRGGSAKLIRKVVCDGMIKTFEEFFTVPMMLRKEFEQLNNIRSQNVDYLLEMGRIDYILVGSTKVIVFNEKAAKYKPNKNKNRTSTIGGDTQRT